MPTKPRAADATIPHSDKNAMTQRRRRMSARRALFIAPPAKKMNASVQLTTPATASMNSTVWASKINYCATMVTRKVAAGGSLAPSHGRRCSMIMSPVPGPVAENIVTSQ